MPDKRPSWFTQFSKAAAHWTGTHYAFTLAISIILIWAITGPIFSFNDTWQLVINTGTTIVTFLMVFLIQNTQNRDSAAIQIKLDELIRSRKGAHNALLDLEELEEEDLEALRKRYECLAAKARKALSKGRKDVERAEVKLEQAEEAVEEVEEGAEEEEKQEAQRRPRARKRKKIK